MTFYKTVIIRFQLQHGPCKYRNWGMHGEKALHPRIENNLLYGERQLSGEFVVYSALTWISCVLVRPLVMLSFK
jgi:hypothetical protein